MAISKERLEELLKQGNAYVYGKYRAYSLRNREERTGDFYWKRQVELVDDKLHYVYEDCDDCENDDLWIDLEDLYENKEDADFVAKYHTSRPEYFKPLTWDKIETIIDKKKRFGLNHSEYVLSRIVTGDSIYYFKLCKDIELFTFELKQIYIGNDLCEQITSRFPISLGKATKENYYKAVEKARKIFLGLKDNE